jgi:hypothetical protein
VSTATAEATKTKTSAGLFLTIIGLLVLIIPWLYVLYAQLTGNVSLSTADSISLLLYSGVAVVAAALGLGVIATLANLVDLFDTPRRGGVSIVFSLLTAVVAAVLLFSIVLPRATTVQHLHDAVIPFGESVSANCKAPLDKTTSDFQMALIDTQSNLSNDSGFAQAMSVDVTVLQFDLGNLIEKLGNLSNLTVPDAQYKPLLQNCIDTMSTEVDFLSDSTGPHAIPLPAPFNTQIPSVSGIGLLQVSAQAASGQSAFGALPPGTVEPLVAQALTLVVNTTNPELTAEGQALAQDIMNGLDTNLAPFKVTVATQ